MVELLGCRTGRIDHQQREGEDMKSKMSLNVLVVVAMLFSSSQFLSVAAAKEAGKQSMEITDTPSDCTSIPTDPDCTTVPENLATMADVSASSEKTSTDQLATKTVDGYACGAPCLPDDCTQEWATMGEGEGAWLKLAWGRPVQIEKIVLYDRPMM